ncbi:long-chain fatty acid--CoA ligase [Mesorhizobium microcysteis]|uniref:Long-chain fatty acid--CoA ligase n=1 Tax=Neoaquamicrobium microcysteis TaxID=2682781 RepID=A0A5D4H1Z4_9HYPH|nr:AMP-binding protein [Mesorhizobium microcysteis]TYR33535.1 long-chain fatty acid--CoA ligase [Mesorhizobium microcysteis]
MSELSRDIVHTTLPHLLVHRARTSPDLVALREKVRGVWRRTTWQEYEQRVKIFAFGLARLGFRRGDRLAIAGEDTPEWLIADLAVQALGGVTVGIYPTNPWAELQYIVAHSQCRFVVCGDQEQVDKILDASSNGTGLPLVEKVIAVDMKGMRKYDDHRLISWEDVESFSAEADTADVDRAWTGALETITPEDICIIVYTSGTTGPPKGAQLRHRNLLHSAAAIVRTYGLTADTYSVLCYLPLCHVGERICSMTVHLCTGGTVSFAESIDTIDTNIREIGPTFFLGMPRVWEKHRLNALIRLNEARPYQKWLFGFLYGHIRRRLEPKLAAGRAPRAEGVLERLEYWGAHLLAFRAMKKHMGLDHSIVRICGGAPVSPETLLFFAVLGLPVYQVYGLTESGGITFLQHEKAWLPGGAGAPIEGVEYRLAEDGEILIRSPTVFHGYLFDEEATQKALSPDGWLSTGDVAERAGDNEIRIVDRKKAIIITSGGKNIAPSEIENALKESLFIREAIILGEQRHFVAALIQINMDSVGKWAQDKGLAYTNYRSLSQLPEVNELIARDVERVNKRFARVESVRKFVILSKELDHDDGELTATQKVKRAFIEKKYAEEIARIYGKEPA